ncbi:unnamed protein product [Durusdinium trenchii]|uniref:Uncharacterized protein n=2 Tax=Durusdinium trenchii TaxID=1381693 RepID=A0ABP0HWI1_9DINO
MDGQAIAFTVQYVELLTSLLGSGQQRSHVPLPDDSVNSRAERLRLIAPSPLSSPVAALGTGSTPANCVEAPKVPQAEVRAPKAVVRTKAPLVPQGPRIMLPPGAIKPHSEYQAERSKKRSAVPMPCPLELPQANTLLSRLSLL